MKHKVDCGSRERRHVRHHIKMTSVIGVNIALRTCTTLVVYEH